MKTTATFKFPKSFKRLLALMEVNDHKRGAAKAAYIDALVSGSQVYKPSKEREAK